MRGGKSTAAIGLLWGLFLLLLGAFWRDSVIAEQRSATQTEQPAGSVALNLAGLGEGQLRQGSSDATVSRSAVPSEETPLHFSSSPSPPFHPTRENFGRASEDFISYALGAPLRGDEYVVGALDLPPPFWEIWPEYQRTLEASEAGDVDEALDFISSRLPAQIEALWSQPIAQALFRSTQQNRAYRAAYGVDTTASIHETLNLMWGLARDADLRFVRGLYQALILQETEMGRAALSQDSE